MEIARALILAEAGDNDCSWATALAGPTHLFPIANRPILFHNLEALRSAGILEATILSGPATARALERAAGDGREWGLTLRYADWTAAGGLGSALAVARDFVADEPVLVQQGDALLRDRLRSHIAAFARERLDALALRLPTVPRVRATLPAPGYLLSRRAVSMLLSEARDPSNPVADVRAMGGTAREEIIDGCLPCHGDQGSLLEGNRRLLEGIETDVHEDSLDDCTIQGPVIVAKSARVRRSLIRGPAIIGPRAELSDAYVGPYTSIGSDVIVEGSQVEHSIVLPGAELRFVGARLESSVIGRGARVVRGFEMPGALRMMIGEEAEVVFT